jgi:hypothetical protein
MRLKQCYLPFSPDRDTLKVLQYDATQLDDLKRKLLAAITVTLERANYQEIEAGDLNAVLDAHSAHGLDLSVDLAEYDEVMLYYRGKGTIQEEKRSPWYLYLRKQLVDVPIYQRLFLLLKLKPEDDRMLEIMSQHAVNEKRARKILYNKRKNLPKDPHGQYIFLKLFKCIPQEDIEMMFPNTEVQFKLFDKIQLGVTTGGSTIAGGIGAVTKMLAAANPIALAGAIFGLGGLIFRQVMGFFNTRNRYMLTLAQRLYFHALADNRGVLALLTDRGEEEDIKEEMLLYYFLAHNPTHKNKLEDLKLIIEQFLQQGFGVNIEFDLQDAMSRLFEDELIYETPQGIIRARGYQEACNRLEVLWREHLIEGQQEDDTKTGTSEA